MRDAAAYVPAQLITNRTMAKNSLRKRSLLAGYRPSCAVFGALALILLTARSDAAETKASCVFCEIAAGTRDATRVVYRDDAIVAFMDRAPRNPGHVLVIPVQHADGVIDVPAATLGRISELAQRVARAIQKIGLRAEGFNVQSNTGAAAGQSVFHLHFHVIPRFKGEPPAGGEKAIAPAAEVEAVAARIRAALATGAQREA